MVVQAGLIVMDGSGRQKPVDAHRGGVAEAVVGVANRASTAESNRLFPHTRPWRWPPAPGSR